MLQVSARTVEMPVVASRLRLVPFLWVPLVLLFGSCRTEVVCSTCPRSAVSCPVAPCPTAPAQATAVARDPLPRHSSGRTVEAQGARGPWGQESMGLVAEMHVDGEADQLLVRTLSFPGKCFPEGWYLKIPKECDETSGRSPTDVPMLVRLRRLRLSDGTQVGERDPVLPRWVKNTHKADEAVLDFSSKGILRLVNQKRELVLHAGDKEHRWKAPGRHVVEDARMTPDGRRVIVAVLGPGVPPFLEGAVILWDPEAGAVSQRIAIRVRQKLYPRSRHHFVFEAMRHEENLQPGRPVRPPPLPLGRPLPRPKRMRLAVSPSGRRVALYAFGDLLVYRVQEHRLDPERRVSDILYIDKESYVKGGTITMSPDGTHLSFAGQSEWVRIVNLETGAREDFVLPSREDNRYSHARYFGSRWESFGAVFDPKHPAVLWTSYFTQLTRHRPDRSVGQGYEIRGGRLTKVRPTRLEEDSPWFIYQVLATKRRLVVLAEGRVLMFDKPGNAKPTFDPRGWVGAKSDLSLRTFVPYLWYWGR